jgi:hypothetical protein
MTSKVVGVERELRLSEQRREQLEQRRELLSVEHSKAVEVRRALLLNGNTTDVKALSKADDRVIAAEVSLSGTDDALTELRAKLAELTAELAEARRADAAESKARDVEAAAAQLERTTPQFLTAATALIDAATVAGTFVSEPKATARLLGEMREAIERDVPRLVSILADNARLLRAPPPPKPPDVVQPQAEPAQVYPEFAKKPYSAPPPERWVDWDSARYHK